MLTYDDIYESVLYVPIIDTLTFLSHFTLVALAYHFKQYKRGFISLLCMIFFLDLSWVCWAMSDSFNNDYIVRLCYEVQILIILVTFIIGMVLSIIYISKIISVWKHSEVENGTNLNVNLKELFEKTD